MCKIYEIVGFLSLKNIQREVFTQSLSSLYWLYTPLYFLWHGLKNRSYAMLSLGKACNMWFSRVSSRVHTKNMQVTRGRFRGMPLAQLVVMPCHWIQPIRMQEATEHTRVLIISNLVLVILIVLATLFSITWYKRVIQRSLMVYECFSIWNILLLTYISWV